MNTSSNTEPSALDRWKVSRPISAPSSFDRLSQIDETVRYLRQHAERCGHDPYEIWGMVQMKMVAAFTPSNPELVVDAMNQAITEYVQISTPYLLTIDVSTLDP